MLLTGVGVFPPLAIGTNAEAVISVDARPLTQPLRPLDLATRLDSISDSDSSTLTIFSRVGIFQSHI